MIANELISPMIPVLKLSDIGDRALQWMQENQVAHLPVEVDGKFHGIISEEDLFDAQDSSITLKKMKIPFQKLSVQSHQHIFEVVKLAVQWNLSVVPVVDSEYMYLGAITHQNLLRHLATFSSIAESGGILVLELDRKQYALSEIARIIESNQAAILGLSTRTLGSNDHPYLEVTLKVSAADLKHIIATFERFEYKVKATYQETEYTDYLKDRYDSLMNYLKL